MAYLSITNVGDIGLYWQIAGLSNPFNTTYYIEAGYSANAVTDGTSTRPSVISSVLATSSGSSYSSSVEYYSSSGTYTPGKQYTSYGWVRAANGKYYSAGSATYTMNIFAPSAPSIGQTWTDAIYITWNSVSGAVDYTIRYNRSGGSYSYITTSNTYRTISPLTPGTTYYFSVMANGQNKSSSYSTESSGTTSQTQLPVPTLNTSLTTKTATSISVTINAVTEATIYYCYLYNSSGSTLISGKSSSSRTFSFTGLSTNIEYAIKIKCGGTGYLDSNWSGFYYATTGLYPWEWFTEKTSGGNFNVTASEWLAFMNKINEVRAAKKLGSWGFGISEVYSGGTFKYYLFTQCANAIADIQNNIGGVNSACQNVQAGDTIYAVYFENLRAALNNVINTL